MLAQSQRHDASQLDPGAALYLQRRFGSAYLDGLSCGALHPVGCRIVLNDGSTLCLHTSKHIGSLSIATSQLDPAAGLFSEEPAYLVGQLQGRQAVLKSRRLRVILNLGVPSTRLNTVERSVHGRVQRCLDQDIVVYLEHARLDCRLHGEVNGPLGD